MLQKGQAPLENEHRGELAKKEANKPTPYSNIVLSNPIYRNRV